MREMWINNPNETTQMSETESENDEVENAEDNAESENAPVVDFSELSESQKEALASNPEVRKMLEFEETSIPQISSMLSNLQENDTATFNLMVEGIAERRGRITEQTVERVLTGFTEEYESVQ